MTSETYALLESVVRRREWTEGQAVITELSDVYSGRIPARYEKYFPKNSMKHVVNMTRLAWDDLATSIGRLPELRGDPANASDAEGRRVSKLEKIGSFYLREAEPSGKIMLWQTAWWMLAGQAVVLVVPNKDKSMPTFTIRDPRTCYPGVRRSVGNQIIELSDLIFKYELPVEEMEMMGLATNKGEGFAQKTHGFVIEYIDENQWVIASDGGTVLRTTHGLGVVPGWVFRPFNPEAKDQVGLSQFQDQLTFMIAISQLISQKIAFGERLIYPMLWTKGQEGSIVKVGPYSLTKLGINGEMGQISPPTTFQVDQDIATLERFSRILNRNPEVRQGEVQSHGNYIGAKTLDQLAESLDTVLGRNWDIISVGIQKLLACAFRMDELLWPDLEKSVNLNYRGKKVREKYTPIKDINGRYMLNVDYGFGMEGYQGFLMNLQAKDAQVMSRKRVIEAMPGISDVEAEILQMDLEMLDDAGRMTFLAQAQNGQMDMLLWAKFRKEMEERGTPLHEVVQKYEAELMAQASQAMTGGGAMPMTTPAEEPVPEAAPAPPGIAPSNMLAGV